MRISILCGKRSFDSLSACVLPLRHKENGGLSGSSEECTLKVYEPDAVNVYAKVSRFEYIKLRRRYCM